jgi:hypothetical protein
MARPERFELPALWFEARCSIQLSYGRVTHYTNQTDALLSQAQTSAQGTQ